MSDEFVDFGKKKQDVVDDEFVDFNEIVAQPPLSLTGLDWKKLEAWKYTPTIPLSQKVITDTEDRTKATVAVSALTGVDPEMVQFGLEPIGEAMYGEKLSPPNLFKRVANTVKFATTTTQINGLGWMQMLQETPERAVQIDELKTTLPTSQEQIKAFPKFLLDLGYGLGYQFGGAVKILADYGMAALSGEAFTKLIGQKPVTNFLDIAQRDAQNYTGSYMGAMYLGLRERGVDYRGARAGAAGFGVFQAAMNAIQIGNIPGVKQLSQNVIMGATTKALLKGTVDSALKTTSKVALSTLAEQGSFAIINNVVTSMLPEVTVALNNLATSGQIPTRPFLDLMKEIGLGTAMQTGGMMLLATPGIILQGGQLHGAMLKAAREVDDAARVQVPIETTGETKVPVAEKPYISPAPGEQKLGAIMALTDEKAAQLDAQVRSAESSADYIKSTDLSKKQIIDGFKAQLEGKATQTRLLKRIEKIDTSEMAPEYTAAIDGVKKQFTLKNYRPETVLKLKEIQDNLAKFPDMELDDVTIAKIGELDKTPYKSLAVDDLQTVTDVLEHYARLAKEEKVIRVGVQTLDREKTIMQIVDEMPKKNIAQKTSSTPTTGELVKDAFSPVKVFFKMSSDLPDVAIGWLGDKAKQILFRNVSDGRKASTKYGQVIDSEWVARTDFIAVQTPIHKWITEKFELNVNNPDATVRPFEITKGEKIAMYMHSLNKDNRRHLLDGGFGFRYLKGERSTVFKITPDELARVVKSMTPDELKVASIMSDLLGRMGRDQAAVFLRVNGFPKEMINNYYHIDTMPIGRKVNPKVPDALVDFEGNFGYIGVNEGHMKDRTGAAGPIFLNSVTYDLERSKNAASLYVNLKEPMTAARKIVTDSRIIGAMDEKFGPEAIGIVKKYLRDVAGEKDILSTTEMLMLKARRNLSTAAIGIPNWFIGPKQMTSIVRYGQYVRPDYIVKSLYDHLYKFKEINAQIREYSSEYIHRRQGGYSKAISDIVKLERPGLALEGGKSLASKSMGATRYFDAWSVRRGMWASVLQALDEMDSDTMSQHLVDATGLPAIKLRVLSPEEKLVQAFKFADYVTERTQAMGVPEFISDLQRSGPVLQMFTNFISEPISSMNMRRRAFQEAVKSGGTARWMKYVKAIGITLLLEPMAQMMIQRGRTAAVGGKQTPIERDIPGTLLSEPTAGIPIAREIVRQAVDVVIKGWQKQDSTLTAVEDLANALTDLIIKSSQIAQTTSTSQRWKLGWQAADNLGVAVGLISGLSYMGLRTNIKMGQQALKLLKEQ
jgi:hypothetical protein